jgi:hypothetical protein
MTITFIPAELKKAGIKVPKGVMIVSYLHKYDGDQYAYIHTPF